MGISEFKSGCIRILKELQTPLIITHRGQPVARIEPIKAGGNRTLGALRHLGTLHANLVETGFAAEWEMEED